MGRHILLFNRKKLTIDQIATLPYEQLQEMERREDHYEFLGTEVERLERINENHRKINGELRVELKDKGVSMKKDKHQNCMQWVLLGANLGICSGVWVTLAYLVFGS